jgi:hypothetical protein
MATCDYCHKEYQPVKWNQKFCRAKCKDDFHNREKKLALREAGEVEAMVGRPQTTETQLQAARQLVPQMRRRVLTFFNRAQAGADLGAEGVNGDAENHKPLSEILQALPKPEPTSFKRKSW